ncbi:MAG TPA: PQQ-binding-like beta-propeller repeat protein [Vicinamibacterales bacterium]|nr:PQQ-binding-like beta-propeller repeat protein [Vicinamibacterales bacterium]
MSRSSATLALCAALAVWLWPAGDSLVQAQTPGGHWPQWRGPDRTGVSADRGLLTSWPEGGPRRLWAASGLGQGFSSVAVADGRILTMGDRRDGQYVIALEEATGRAIWAHRVGGVHRDQYPGPRGTPTIDGARTYALSSDGTLVGLETATGREVWRRSLPADYNARTPGWMFAESPLVDGDRVVVAPGMPRAAMAALDKATGREIWRTTMPSIGRQGMDSAEYSSIVISNGGGVKQYVRLIGRGVIGVRASDGEFLWGYNRVANPTANIPTPVVNGNLVFASTGYSAGAALLELMPSPEETVTARERYFLSAGTFQNHHGGMVLLNGYVYAGTGHNNGLPICIELASGKVAWGGNFRNAGSGSAAVTAADGHIYYRYQNGVMMLVEATPTEYREKGSFTIPNVRLPSWSHPVVTGGRLYLREQDALHVYDLRR